MRIAGLLTGCRAGVLARAFPKEPMGWNPASSFILKLSHDSPARTVFAALAGLAFGSFLNVFATRWPEARASSAPAPTAALQPRAHVVGERPAAQLALFWAAAAALAAHGSAFATRSSKQP